MPFCRICDEQIDDFDPRKGEPVCDDCLYGSRDVPKTSFADPVHFNCSLQESELPKPGVEDLLDEINKLAKELCETTKKPEGCDQWLPKSTELLLAVSAINVVCHRITDRANKTRAQRRAAELISGIHRVIL